MAQQQHRKINESETENFVKKKNPRPLSCNNCLPAGTLCTSQEKNKMNSRASLSASYTARPSGDYLVTDSVRVKVSSLSVTVIPVARPA